MQWLVIIVLCISALLAAALVRQGNKWGKPAAFGCSAFCLILAIPMLFGSGVSSLQQGWNDRKTTLEAEGYVLGAYLNKNFAGRRVVVMPPLPSFGETPRMPLDSVHALIQSTRGSLTIHLAELDAPSAGGNPVTTDVSTAYDSVNDLQIGSEELRSQLSRSTTDVDIVVIAFNHEAYLDQWRAMHAATAPALVLLHASHDQLANVFQQGVIEAATVYAPPPEARSLIKDPKTRKAGLEFARSLFTVATRQNYKDVLSE